MLNVGDTFLMPRCPTLRERLVAFLTKTQPPRQQRYVVTHVIGGDDDAGSIAEYEPAVSSILPFDAALKD